MPRLTYASFPALATFLALMAARDVTALTNYPYLPGGTVNQLVEAEGFLFAAVGENISVPKQPSAGFFLYRSRIDSLDWKLIGRSDSVYGRGEPMIRYVGRAGGRLFFNREDAKTHHTEDAGDTWTPLGGIAFASNLITIGNAAYAVFDKKLQVSQDRGSTWQPRSLANLEAFEILFDSDTLFAIGTSFSFSIDTGKTWKTVDKGFPRSSTVGTPAKLHQLSRFGGKLLCATNMGVFHLDSATQWLTFGRDLWSIAALFPVGDRLFGGSRGGGLRVYDPVRHEWMYYQHFGAAGRLQYSSGGTLAGMIPHSGLQILGGHEGVAVFDTVKQQSAWADWGMFRYENVDFWMPGRNVAVIHRSSLFLMRPGSAPMEVKAFDYLKDAAIVSKRRSDSALWIYSDSTLYRYRLAGSSPQLLDSLRAPPGNYTCLGDTLIGLRFDYRVPDSLHIAFSLDAGRTFRQASAFAPLGPSWGGGFPVSIYFQEDTLRLWDSRANVLNYRLSDGSYRFARNEYPLSSMSSLLHAAPLPSGILAVFTDMVLQSRDGGASWTLANKGLNFFPGGRQFQSVGGRVYLGDGNLLYYSDATRIEWTRLDLSPLAGKGGIKRSVVTAEGIAVAQGIDGYAFQEWSGIPLSIPRAKASMAAPKARSASVYRRGSILLVRDGAGYAPSGRRMDIGRMETIPEGE